MWYLTIFIYNFLFNAGCRDFGIAVVGGEKALNKEFPHMVSSLSSVMNPNNNFTVVVWNKITVARLTILILPLWF